MSGLAYDIGVGGRRIWVIGTNKEAGGYGIYRWEDNRYWKKIGGSAIKIDVDQRGRAWVVNKFGNIYYWTGSKWAGVSGGAKDVGVGSRGKVWVIGTNRENGGYGIYRRDGSSWTKIGGAAVRVSVCGNGNAWVVNSKGSIYEYRNGRWSGKPGAAIDVSCNDNHVAVVGTNRSPYRWLNGRWQKTTGSALSIDVGVNGRLLITSPSKRIQYQRV